MELGSVWVHRKIGRLTGGKTLRQCHWIDVCLFIRPSVVYVTIKVEHCEWKDIFPDTFLDSFRLSDRTTSPLIFLAFRIPPRNRIYLNTQASQNILIHLMKIIQSLLQTSWIQKYSFYNLCFRGLQQWLDALTPWIKDSLSWYLLSASIFALHEFHRNLKDPHTFSNGI